MRAPPNRRLLVVANWRDSDHPEAGGAEGCCEEVAARLAAMGEQVVYLTARIPGRPRRERRDGYEVVRTGGRFSVYVGALLWLAGHRRRISGVIDSQNGIPFFSPLVLRTATPVVLLMHHVHQSQFGEYFSPLTAMLGRWLERTGARWVYGQRAVAAMSPSTRHGTRSQLRLRGPIFVVPPGCTVTSTVDPAERDRARHPKIVCVGRLVRHKRPHLVVEAMPALIDRLPDLRLEIVGDGPERDRISELVDRLGLAEAVAIRGALAAEERDAILSTAWLAVNTSEAEGWALTVVEANAMGVPVLGLRVPGLRDSIRHGETGWLIDEDADLAQAIAHALADLNEPEAALAISRRAVEWSGRFSWQETAEQLAQILEAERGRLQHRRNDRRQRTDLAMVVYVPDVLIPRGWSPSFRLTDRVMGSEDGMSIFLPGTDARSARLALRRSGLATEVVEDPRVRFAVARPIDHIAPAFSSLAATSSIAHATPLVPRAAAPRTPSPASIAAFRGERGQAAG